MTTRPGSGRSSPPEEMQTYEDQVTFPGGRRWFLSSVHPVRDDQGRIYAAQIMSQDITERKQAQEEKERLQSQLHQAQKMESIGTLAGGVAHDFNNLLQAVGGYTQMLLLDKKQDHPDYPNLKGIQRAGDRASELVRQLLLFSRKMEAEPRPVNLNHEVGAVRDMLARTIPKMIDIEIYLEGELWTVTADPVQMERVLLNLGANAADAMPEGGKLVFETKNVLLDDEYTQKYLELKPGRYVLLAVSDTGRGMDEQTLEHIFEPFYTTKDIGKGTGLGLASAYGIVQSHGGNILCYSEPDRGTTFKIYLPAVDQPDAGRLEEPPARPPHGRGETVLVVDDEESVRDLSRQALKSFGYLVRTASSGEEALEIYAGRPGGFDLVLMDIGMPGMGGHACLREILALDPKAKVLIASGYTTNGQVKKKPRKRRGRICGQAVPTDRTPGQSQSRSGRGKMKGRCVAVFV